MKNKSTVFGHKGVLLCAIALAVVGLTLGGCSLIDNLLNPDKHDEVSDSGPTAYLKFPDEFFYTTWEKGSEATVMFYQSQMSVSNLGESNEFRLININTSTNPPTYTVEDYSSSSRLTFKAKSSGTGASAYIIISESQNTTWLHNGEYIRSTN